MNDSREYSPPHWLQTLPKKLRPRRPFVASWPSATRVADCENLRSKSADDFRVVAQSGDRLFPSHPHQSPSNLPYTRQSLVRSVPFKDVQGGGWLRNVYTFITPRIPIGCKSIRHGCPVFQTETSTLRHLKNSEFHFLNSSLVHRAWKTHRTIWNRIRRQLRGSRLTSPSTRIQRRRKSARGEARRV